MSDARELMIGGATYAIPPMPLRLSRKAYPLCMKLTKAGIAQRYVAAFSGGGSFEVTEDEWSDLADVALLTCQSADAGLTREAFDELPITPAELLAAFFEARYATGGWVPSAPSDPGGDPAPGEAMGAETPPE